MPFVDLGYVPDTKSDEFFEKVTNAFGSSFTVSRADGLTPGDILLTLSPMRGASLQMWTPKDADKPQLLVSGAIPSRPAKLVFCTVGAAAVVGSIIPPVAIIMGANVDIPTIVFKAILVPVFAVLAIVTQVKSGCNALAADLAKEIEAEGIFSAAGAEKAPSLARPGQVQADKNGAQNPEEREPTPGWASYGREDDDLTDIFVDE